LSLFLFSCGKKRSIVITAKNPVTGQPYAGLSYYVVSSRGNGSRTEASGVLNENGEAAVTLRIKDRSYNVRVVAPENTCYNKNITLSYNYPYDNNHVFSFEFAECAYLTLAVNNVDCQGSADRILFDLQPTYIENYTNIIPVEKFGCYNNTFIESQIPYGPWSATWEVTKNGITTFHDSLFFIGQNEHYTFTINY